MNTIDRPSIQDLEIANKLLYSHGLRKTENGRTLLLFLRQKNVALSHGELMQEEKLAMDRATLYRMLQRFEDHGLVHRVVDDEVSVKYALCTEACSSSSHRDDHIHFKCSSCGQTQCLEQTTVPQLSLPPNLQVQRTEVLVSGLCQYCQ